MDNPRRYGRPPFRVALVHGGPGAPGGLAPVARALSARLGVLEPLQTADSLEGQVMELARLLGENATPPLALVGASWGAWLSIITAARHPALVNKVVLVGSAPFEERYATGLMATRLARLDEGERVEVETLLAHLAGPDDGGKDGTLARLGRLLARADAYDPLPDEEEALPASFEVHRRVWAEASALRRSGGLLALARAVRCPVVAVHGDYDPHPAEGVAGPLGKVVKDFRFVLLERCGHEPWRERQARERFYEILEQELE